MSSVQTNFTNNVGSFIQQTILVPIVNHLTAKGITVTIEELVEVLQLPATRNLGVPAMAFGGAIPPVTASVPKRTNTASATPGTGCTYVFKRGKNKQLCCGKKCFNGSERCNTKNHQIKNPVATPGGFAPNQIPGMAGYSEPQEDNQHSIDVTSYDKSKGLSKTNDNIIVKEKDETILAIGYLDEVQNKIISLTDDQKHACIKLGMAILPDDTPQTIAKSPSIPGIPSIPSPVAAVPSIPSIPSPVAAIPSIPSIPSPITAVPSIPSIPSVPEPSV